MDFSFPFTFHVPHLVIITENIWWELQITKVLILQFFQPPPTSSTSYQNALFSILFWITFSPECQRQSCTPIFI